MEIQEGYIVRGRSIYFVYLKHEVTLIMCPQWLRNNISGGHFRVKFLIDHHLKEFDDQILRRI